MPVLGQFTFQNKLFFTSPLPTSPIDEPPKRSTTTGDFSLLVHLSATFSLGCMYLPQQRASQQQQLRG
jgi:hypothetical protein